MSITFNGQHLHFLNDCSLYLGIDEKLMSWSFGSFGVSALYLKSFVKWKRPLHPLLWQCYRGGPAELPLELQDPGRFPRAFLFGPPAIEFIYLFSPPVSLIKNLCSFISGMTMDLSLRYGCEKSRTLSQGAFCQNPHFWEQMSSLGQST